MLDLFYTGSSGVLLPKELKKYYDNNIGFRNRYFRYNEWRKVYNEMAVHVNGTLPEKLISTKRPKEDNDIYAYRIANYQPTTMGILREAIHSLHRIFQSQNYEFKTSFELKEYISKPVFNNHSFMGFVENHILYNMILDPNAILVVLPTGEGLRNSTALVNPKPYVIPSENIRSITPDFISFISNEKSLVYQDTDAFYDGEVYYIVTKNEIIKAFQSGQKKDENYEYEIVYSHNFGEIPYTVLGGEWNSSIMAYESYFNCFVPIANELIKAYTDLQAISVTSLYPVRIVRGLQCEACNGVGKVHYTEPYSKQNVLRNCNVCSGTGNVPPSTPYGVYTRPMNENGNDNSTSPMLEYVSPDPEIIRVAMEFHDSLLNRAKESIHLDYINESQSGIAKDGDREREYSMILKISNNIYDNVITRCLVYFEKYINISNPKLPSVVKPKEFSLKSESKLLSDLNNATAGRVSKHILNSISLELVKNRYYGDLDTLYKNEFFLEYDELYNYSTEEIQAYKLSGDINRKSIVKHIRGRQILERILRSNDIEVIPSNYDKLAEMIDKEIDAIIETEIKDANNQIQDLRYGDILVKDDYGDYSIKNKGKEMVYNDGGGAVNLPEGGDYQKFSEV